VHSISILKYGSDPLKTYLPDSDIDLTIILNNQLKKKGKAENEIENVEPIK